MKKKQLQEMWSNSLLKSANCITINDYNNAEKYMEEAIQHLNSMRTEFEYYSHPITNFGVLNRLVSENIDELHNNFPDFITDWVALIKEDANLKAQYIMYEGLSAFDETLDAQNYIAESVKIASENINRATLKESNMKAFDLLKKHELIIPDTLTESDEKYYSACQFMLENKKDGLTLSEHAKAEKTTSSYITEAAKTKSKTALSALAEHVNQLNQEEYTIIEAALSGEDKQREVYDKLKSECIAKVDETIKTNDGDQDDIDRLQHMKEILDKSSYNPKTFREDILKLVSFKEI